jgi:hypothetical protein
MVRCRGLLILAMVASVSSSLWAIDLGQIDTFEDGTTQNWTDGAGGSGEVNITTGGPAGSNDNYLQVSSGAFGGPIRLITFNRMQWLGDFVSAGVNAIEMDLRNFGASPLSMRIAIREDAGGAGSPAYVTSTPFLLPADDQWHHAVFSLDESSLTALFGPSALATVLSNPAEVRIYSSVAVSEIGDFISGQFGVDNITAMPEPGALYGLATVFVWGLARRR